MQNVYRYVPNTFITGHKQIAVTLTFLEEDGKVGERKIFTLTAMLLYNTTYRRIREMDERGSYDAAISFFLEVTEYRK